MNLFKVEEGKNLLTYVAFLLIAAIGIYYGNTLRDVYPNLRIWDMANLLILLIGVPFVLLQSKAQLPGFWQTGISRRHRFLIPLAIGLFFGILDVIVFKGILHPEPYTELPPFLQPFPYSLFLYFSGALEVEVFYRLLPLSLFMLLGTFYKKGRYLNTFFWIAAVLTALREPLEQLSENHWAVMVYALLSGFAMNLLQAVFFRKAGFLASLSIRLGHYLLWHILLGVYVEYIELG